MPAPASARQPVVMPPIAAERNYKMATVRTARRKNGTPFYRAIWHVTDPAGKRAQFTKSFDKRSEAKAYAATMAIEVERRGVGDPHKQSVKTFLKRWLATLRQSGSYSPATLAAYERHAGHTSREIGHVQIS